jgi:predicted amidophosphoribosyltransferase
MSIPKDGNVRNVFPVSGPLERHPAPLIDDVMTTGATLNEPALTVKRARAGSVGALVITRAVRMR